MDMQIILTSGDGIIQFLSKIPGYSFYADTMPISIIHDIFIKINCFFLIIKFSNLLK